MPDEDLNSFGETGSATAKAIPELQAALRAREDGKSGPLVNNTDIPPGEMAGGAFKVDIDNLRGIVKTWTHEDDRIGEDGFYLTNGAMTATEPAVDPISTEYAKMLRSTLREFVNHNLSMGTYSARCVENLNGSIAGYNGLDDRAARQYRVDE